MSIRTATASKAASLFPGFTPDLDLDFRKSKKLDGRITARRATSGTGVVDGKLVTFPVDTQGLRIMVCWLRKIKLITLYTV